MSFMDKMDKLKALKNIKKNKKKYRKPVKGGGSAQFQAKYYAQGGNVSDSPTSGAVFDKSDMAGGNQTSNYGIGGRRAGKPKKKPIRNFIKNIGKKKPDCHRYWEDGGRNYANGGGFNVNSGVSSEANFDKEDMAGGNQSANTARGGRRLFGPGKGYKKRRTPVKSAVKAVGRAVGNIGKKKSRGCAAYWEDGGRNTAARGRRLFGAGKGYKSRRTPIKNAIKGIGNAIRRKPKVCPAYR